MEGMGMNREFWQGRRVLLTGHTGFKGGWLALWLNDMGAEVYGYALNPPTIPNIFTATSLASRMAGNTISDIRDLGSLVAAFQVARPEIVFHLAAQPLVRQSYTEPLETYDVNVMGTLNVLEAVRRTLGVRAVINVTTDKCYENREWEWPYREYEALGGFDPYSSSKACSELITAAYRRSFFGPSQIHLASARAGNVIGGGDWASDRIVPDFLRAQDSRRPLVIRSPRATRPWQHVLEPLSGYLTLAHKLVTEGEKYAEAWNFGPEETDTKTVQWVIEYLHSLSPETSFEFVTSSQLHEASALKLDSSRAKILLGWRPRWSLDHALDLTMDWHHAWKENADMAAFCVEQIRSYEEASQKNEKSL